MERVKTPKGVEERLKNDYPVRVWYIEDDGGGHDDGFVKALMQVRHAQCAMPFALVHSLALACALNPLVTPRFLRQWDWCLCIGQPTPSA
jgi:hypothetical protein